MLDDLPVVVGVRRHASIAALVAAMLFLGTSHAACPHVLGPVASMSLALDALEPGFVRPGPIALGAQAHPLLQWLRDREDAAWSTEALHELARRYDIVLVTSAGNGASLPLDWISHARQELTVTGLAVVDERGVVQAAGVYWRSPFLERLRIVPVPPGTSARRARDLGPTLGPLVSTCAVQVEDWIVLSEDLAQDLLRASDEVWMLAFGEDDGHGGGSWTTWTPAHQIEEALRFQHPGIPPDAAEFSAMFYGRSPSLLWTLRNAPRASTTLGIGDLTAWIRGLFRR